MESKPYYDIEGVYGWIRFLNSGGPVESAVPETGNIAGAVAGFLFGIVVYVITDVIKVKGKTLRDYIKIGSFSSAELGWENG